MVARSECHGHMETCGRGDVFSCEGHLESYARWDVHSWQGQLGSYASEGRSKHLVGPPKLERL